MSGLTDIAGGSALASRPLTLDEQIASALAQLEALQAEQAQQKAEARAAAIAAGEEPPFDPEDFRDQWGPGGVLLNYDKLMGRVENT